MSRRTYAPGWLTHYCGLIGAWARGSQPSADAEDALQDVATRLLGSEASALRDARAYLQRSVQHGLAGRHRQQTRRPTVPLDALGDDEPLAHHDVESAAYVAQLSGALAEALAELPPVCQQVFAWHRLEGWSVPDIARHMGLSVSSVEKALTRCMRHLHQKLRHFSPEA